MHGPRIARRRSSRDSSATPRSRSIHASCWRSSEASPPERHAVKAASYTAMAVPPRIAAAFEGLALISTPGEKAMSLGLILLIVVILMLVGAVPAWPHSRGWGYGPSGGLGLVLVIVIVLMLMHYI